MSEIIDRFEREFPQHKEAAERLRRTGEGSYLLTSLLQLIVDFKADCERLEKEKEQAYTLGLRDGKAQEPKDKPNE